MTVGKLPLVFFGAAAAASGSGVPEGEGGTDMSSDSSASPPRASNSSDCLLFLLPSFIPPLLNAGGRNEEGAGDEVRAGVVGVSNRCGTGWYPEIPPPR